MYKDALVELQTIRDFIRWSASQFVEGKLFFGHGTNNALDEAAWLILSTLHLPNQIDQEYLSCRLTRAEREKLIEVLRQRIEERRPVPYLLKEAWFGGLPFYVDERVLIPRSPLAETIADHFSPWCEADKIDRVLDLCTGSGCIAIAVALQFPYAEVHASDISVDALEVAQINCSRYHLQDELQLIESDLFQNIPRIEYDVIISNPPYVDREEMESRPAEFLHEPELALASGDDGLDAVRVILKKASDYLSTDGVLIVEVGASQPQLEEAFPELPFTWIEFEHGGDGVFVLSREQLTSYNQES